MIIIGVNVQYWVFHISLIKISKKSCFDTSTFLLQDFGTFPKGNKKSPKNNGNKENNVSGAVAESKTSKNPRRAEIFGK